MSTARLKIIVAEDSEIQRLYLCSLLDAMGHETIPAEDGQQALALLQDSKAQIVLSDLQMPNLNGIDLTRSIRALDLDRYVHVIVITGSDEIDVRQEALEAGVDDFFTKGDSPTMLRARIMIASRSVTHAAELAKRTQVLKEANDRILDDLRAAAAAQQQLLPDIQDDILGFKVASAFVPSAIVSGDMFGCSLLDDETLGFYAVDVSGHGVHASLLSVAIGHLITPEYFRDKARTKDGLFDPANLVGALNVRFSAADNDEYFTMFCGLIDKSSGNLVYCQAGYPSPYHVTKDGIATPVGDGGFPVGMIGAATYENRSLDVSKGDALVMCSDGASEAENPNMEPFGNDRVQNAAASLSEIGVRNFPDALVDQLKEWRAGHPIEDDLTVVALERSE